MRARKQFAKSGLFRELIDLALEAELDDLDALEPTTNELDAAQLPERIGDAAAGWVTDALRQVPDAERHAAALAVMRRLAVSLNELAGDSVLEDDHLADPLRELVAIEKLDPSGAPVRIPRPLTPIGDTVLLTNARGEPSLLHEIQAEIGSADRIDLVLAFIRWSGIRPLLATLRDFVGAGKPLRIITTTYTGSTEARALTALRDIGAQVKVSYDTKSTRLHAKAWHFHRSSGQSTVYIGSSNLTYSAQISGIEWNVRAAEHKNPNVVRSFTSTFESYWQDSHFEPYEEAEFERSIARHSASGDQRTELTMFDIKPYPYQQAMLDRLEVERLEGRPNSLIVAATGTGKTIVAGLDYARLRKERSRSRVLFIAHRKEILRRSRETFRHILRNGSFGELWVDGQRPKEWEHVFASIQSMSAVGLKHLPPDHFDIVIVDEFHHAAAATYAAVLDHVRPQHLLGLTATPERHDGLDIARWFGDRYAVELRLWDALEQQHLSPFHYFGIADGTDLREVSWSSGKYSTSEIENLYTADDMWVSKVLQSVRDIVADPQTMSALGFCVSIGHAEFVADRFNKAGIRSAAVTSDTPQSERDRLLGELRDGKCQILFAVDLFNEGVDVPRIDTILMLRPTESATVFLQQLGRGLRKDRDKSVLTVLDFVGNQRNEFRFDKRFRRLLGRTRRQVEADVQQGFPFLPAGCEINLDRESQEMVLANIRAAVPGNVKQRVAELRMLGDIPLADFVHDAGLDLADIYSGSHYWTSLRRRAGFVRGEEHAAEKTLGRGAGRLLHVNDADRLTMMRRLADADSDLTGLTAYEGRQLTMLLMVLLSPRRGQFISTADAVEAVRAHPEICEELVELASALEQPLEYVQQPVELVGVPLRERAHYGRDEILAAFGAHDAVMPMPHQEGVYWSEPHQTDVLLVTLDKSSESFSPTTRYLDFAVSDRRFQWESQGSTRVDSVAGRRYLSQRSNQTNVALFVRSRTKNLRGGTEPYFFAGLCDYLSHESERPIKITWELRTPLPGAVFGEFRAAVA